MRMFIYEISQSVNDGWDTYDSAIVYAADEIEAAGIHPSGRANDEDEDEYGTTWAPSDQVKVRLVGQSVDDVRAGVICASFNAG